MPSMTKSSAQRRKPTSHGASQPPQRKATRPPGRLAWWAGVGAIIAIATVATAIRGGSSGGDATNSPGGSRAEAVTVRPGGTPEVGGQAPAFSMPTIDGSTFAFPTGKPTAIFFTAAYCRSCLPKAEALAAIQRQVGDEIAVLGVDMDPSDTVGAFRQWIEAAGNPPFAFAMDRDSRLVSAYRVQALSTVIVTDGTGEVVFRSFIEGDEATLRDALTQAGLT